MKKHAEETWECATVSGRDLVLLLGNCADTIEIYKGRSRFDRPKQSRAIPTRQIYKPRYARRAFGPPRFARKNNTPLYLVAMSSTRRTAQSWLCLAHIRRDWVKSLFCFKLTASGSWAMLFNLANDRLSCHTNRILATVCSNSSQNV